MGLYTKGVYPELSYQERADNIISARTYDALINILRLRDLSEGETPSKIADQNEQRSMEWFLS
jgi:hypothetical protein|tara:strand:+ start:1124 stop:1312 length:189 start_codon:yes stop_codon:yes gene_type:complete